MTVNDAVAYRVLKLMEEKNMTQYKLEKQSSIPHGAMDRILSSKNRTITLTTLYKISNGLHMNLLEFLNDKIFLSDKIEL